MKFRIGERVYINAGKNINDYTGVVTDRENTPFGTLYNVKLDSLNGADNMPLVTEVPEKNITSLEREGKDAPTKVFGTDGLIATLEEITETLKSSDIKLIENVVNHDYYERENKHYITINMTLKEHE